MGAGGCGGEGGEDVGTEQREMEEGAVVGVGGR
jgi:hypothetical protein